MHMALLVLAAQECSKATLFPLMWSTAVTSETKEGSQGRESVYHVMRGG